MKRWGVLLSFLLSVGVAGAASTPQFKRLDSSCVTCNELNKLCEQHNVETSGNGRINLILKMAKVIKTINLKGKPKLEQQREIYYAMTTTLQVMNDDFDGETGVRLMDLRAQAPKVFDEVLWSLPITQQNDLIARMRALKANNLRPKAEIPKAKATD